MKEQQNKTNTDLLYVGAIYRYKMELKSCL